MNTYKTIKRIGDLIGASCLLLLFSPVFLLIIITLFASNKGGVFFVQKRPGKNEKTFSILKFKTMNDKKNSDGHLLPDVDRLTAFGIILRKTSLDELPQLINVIKGDMSFVGPRPLLVRYLPYYFVNERKRHSIRPGLTGLAQISGRNLLNWDDRLQKDIEYVENISFRLDTYILFETLKKVISREDVVVAPDTMMDDLETTRKKLKPTS